LPTTKQRARRKTKTKYTKNPAARRENITYANKKLS